MTLGSRSVSRKAPIEAGPAGPGPVVMTPMSSSFLESTAAWVTENGPEAAASRVQALVSRHERWRVKCLNLLAAENSISRKARRLLDSTLATRLTEGFPGDKQFPPVRHHAEIDEIEGIFIALARQLVPARFVEWRATSNTMANAMALAAVTKPGDTILVQSMTGGGNMSYHPGAVPELLRLEVADLPPGPDMGFALDGARAAARTCRPAAIVVGGSYFLFPLPVAELRAIADEVGAVLIYDAAHVGLLIATGLFQAPLAEGADILTMGTHKIMGGPVGGLLFTDRADLGARIVNRTYPLFLQTRDQNKYAAAAHSLAELVQFGPAYARQMVANAKTLAAAVEREGFAVLGRARGYTMTHQLMLDARGVGGGLLVEKLCQASNILLHKAWLVGDQLGTTDRGGLRITVQEVTRQGMKEAEMEEIASLIGRAAVKREATERVAADVERFVARFPRIEYSFDDEG